METRALRGTFVGAHLRLLTERSVLWLLRLLRDPEPSPESHAYLAEHYGWLAAYHRRKGNAITADRYSVRAARHARLGPDDDPPPLAVAAALAVPQPASDSLRPDTSPYLGDNGDVA